MSTETVLHRLHSNGRLRPNAPAYYVKTGQAWVSTPWHEYLSQVRQAARALIALGIEPGGTTCILGFNRPEWVIFDLATMLVGGVPAGIYTTNSPQECKYIIEHSQASVVLVENEYQWRKINEVREDIATLKRIVLMQGTDIADPMTLGWEEFMAQGDSINEAEVDERLNSLQMDQLATLIYTSGTTGPPKGVMLSHNNLAWTANSAIGLFNLVPSDSVLSYLPLSHIAEQMFTIHAAITVGFQVYYAQYPPQDYLNDNFKEIQPTLVFGVPRIWERFAAGVQDKLAENRGI
jgi:long-chain acyl-CoA synthetase